MTSLLMLCFFALAAFSWVQLRRTAKHDRIRFPFCQLRRDIMRFLREHMPGEPNALSKAEYDSILRLQDVVSTVIGHYKEHKTVMFNLRKVIKFSREYQEALDQVAPIDMTDNAEIKKFHHQFRGLLAMAFFAYTPLIRSENLLRVFVAAYRAGRTHTQNAGEITRAAHAAHEDKRRYGALANTVMAAA